MTSKVDKCREYALGMHSILKELKEHQKVTESLIERQAGLLKGLADSLTDLSNEVEK